MTKTTEAIGGFLNNVPVNFAKDLTQRYNPGMEVQVMVDPTGGEPVYEDDRLIRNTWSCSPPDMESYTFHHIRVPRNAMSEPYFNDTAMKFPLMRHVECIGMTGWNWQLKKSLWVGFDFDSITGHAAGVGVDDESLLAVRKAASNIPWVQVRKSTGGSGLHLYVYFDPSDAPDTENHNVHAALARAVLGMMEREAGFDFRGNMDVLGGNMWCWHRKINADNEGLAIIKDCDSVCPRLPANWRDNVDVVNGTSSKIKFNGVDSRDYDSFEAQTSSRVKIELDDTHKLIEERIHELGYTIVWVPDHHCWQTHTHAFVELMNTYPDEYRGVFATHSSGSDKGKPNCFAFPVKDGGLRLTRFGRGAAEHDTWRQDGNDWTWTFFNRPPSLQEAAAVMGGAEDPDGKGWVFGDLDDAAQAAALMGGNLKLDDTWMEVFGQDGGRSITMRENKDKQLVLEMPKKANDRTPKGWIAKGRKFTTLLRNVRTEHVYEEEETTYDDRVRALVDMNNEFSQWVCRNEDGEWVGHSKDNTRSALRIWAPDDVETILGRLILKNWKIVNVPFQPEYLGNRKWNRHAPQFAVTPGENGDNTRHWDMVLDHCGQDLDESVAKDQWCKDNGILTGADYLRYWIAFTFRDPYCKLPYLFFYGPQNSGKSVLHEALSILTTGGIALADEALKSKSGFNGELAGAVLCVVEETNLNPTSAGGRTAYDRMKAWVTGEEILIHAKYQQPFPFKNTTHWMQMANDKSYVPIFPGDTRVVMMYVPMIEGVEIPKHKLLDMLRAEAPSFLRSICDLKLVSPPGRLRLPVLETDSKREASEDGDSLVYRFIREECHMVPGYALKLKDFYDAFAASLDETERLDWSYNRVIDEFRGRGIIPMGRASGNITCIGNVSLMPAEAGVDYGKEYIQSRQRIIRRP